MVCYVFIMQKEEHAALKSLVLEVFDKAAEKIETRLDAQGEDVVAESLWDDVLQEFPILHHRDNAAMKDALIEQMISQGLLPVEEGETEQFFLHILNKLEASNKSQAYQNAGLALRVLSEGQSQISVPAFLRN